MVAVVKLNNVPAEGFMRRSSWKPCKRSKGKEWGSALLSSISMEPRTKREPHGVLIVLVCAWGTDLFAGRTRECCHLPSSSHTQSAYRGVRGSLTKILTLLFCSLYLNRQSARGISLALGALKSTSTGKARKAVDVVDVVDVVDANGCVLQTWW